MHQKGNLEGYTGQSGWGESHALTLPTTAAYIEAAHERRKHFADVFHSMTSGMGSGITVVEPFIKSQESADRKLWDRTSRTIGKPDMIGDYLRARVYIPVKPNSISQLDDSIGTMLEHPLLVGFKDAHWAPNKETGWRVTIGAIEIEGMRCEMQVVADSMSIRAASALSDGLRSVERLIRHGEERLNEVCLGGDKKDAKTYSKLVQRAEASMGGIRECRKALHDFAFATSGVNALMNPSVAERHTPLEAGELRKMFKDMGRQPFGGQIVTRFMEPVKAFTSLQLH